MTDVPRDFRRRWWLANSAAFAVGEVSFSLVGHGLTGPHGDELTRSQYVAHTVGLICLGLIVLAAQRAALKPWRPVTWSRVTMGIVALVASFWFGAEALRPPADWILGFTVLGAASWLRLPNREEAKTFWALLAVASYWLGICAALASVITWDRVVGPDPSSLLDHTVGWLIVGAATGLVGGYVSSWPLRRLLLVPGRAAES